MRPFRIDPPSAAERALEGAPTLRVVAAGSFAPRGEGYDPRAHLRQRVRALRGGEDALVLRFVWVDRRVRVDVLASGSATSEDVERALEAARGIAAVDDDPSGFFPLIKGRRLLVDLARRVDTRLSRAPTVFESFAVAVIEQLVTGVESRAAIRRLWRLAGEAVPRTELRAAPTARAVRAIPMWRMHALGIGAKRAATLREGSLRGDALERLAREDAAVVVDKLQTIRGVGPWTANHVARHALGWSDAVPVGDFHAPYVITQALTGEEGGDDAMLAALEPFRPHRARVALLLERAHVRGGVPGMGRWRPPRVDPHRREPWRY